MTLPDLHLAGEALAALVDGELGPGAYHRAVAHLVRCGECRSAVAFQREAKAVLAAGGLPTMPEGLFARLHEVPMTADLGPGGPGSGGDLVLSGDLLLWSGASRVSGVATGRGADRQRSHSGRRGLPWPGRMSSQRMRRGVAGALAGVAVGVLGAAAPGGGQSMGLQLPGGATVTGPQVLPASVVVATRSTRSTLTSWSAWVHPS
ncbi:MAG: hypothetical protein HYR62_09715 [Actinobacteria bacterium]|nr:hypothetical protein [Actinomycetota bacterium]MBI3687968.1 hypothetical protein [Actinomycetota bacterium]